MGSRLLGMLGAAAVAVLALLPAAPAQAFAPPPTLGAGGCYDPTQSNADFEAYGPTDVSAQAGNNRVTVNENAAGTLTVFKYPNPSLYNQIKYFAVSRDQNGHVHNRFPNEGSFAGIRWRTGRGTGFAWLRDWRATQGWDSSDLPVPVTRYRSPKRIGLSVTVFDLAPPRSDAFVRELWVTRARRSPVRQASVTYFANFNPVASHVPLLPIGDWCTPGSDQHAAYDRAAHAVVNSWAGTDQATGKATAVAVAFGFDKPDSSHQVGQDAYDPAAGGSGGPDGYDQARTRPYRLGGDTVADDQTTGALSRVVHFDRRGRAAERVVIAGGTNAGAALTALRGGRKATFAGQLAAERSDWRGFLSHARLPAHAPRRVTAVAKRSLISLRIARAPGTGAIVASANTQGPYGEDWIRDGAFLNRMLDENGYATLVTQHNLFYARIQASPANPSAIRPSGNWTMAAYADGIDGAPIPWEIDETGLGIWTLYDHSTFLQGAAAHAYLAQVYPAIVRSADFLTLCEDRTNGMQCTANEDDNYTPSQSLHGAETVFLGLRSAVAAAKAMGDTDVRVGLWQARLDRLRAAIDRLYDPGKRAYGEGASASNAYNLDYSDGGWLLWPVQFKPYDDPTMRGEADAVDRALRASLAAPRGQYEAKALLGLAYARRRDPAELAQLRGPLAYMARALTTPTGLFGESWIRDTKGRPLPVQDMPHVWEHALFYLAALKIDGARRYTFERTDAFTAACRSGTVPRRACRSTTPVTASRHAGPGFTFVARKLSPALRRRITGVSWHRGCPVGLARLRYLRIAYHGFDGRVHTGEMVANASAVRALERAFAALYRSGFPIRRMRLVDDYGGSDFRSIEADNTSAFNCRRTTGQSSWSQHAYGRAVDVNPIENPYVSNARTAHPASRRYLDRSRHRRGMAYAGGALVRAFDRAGWGWGGTWSNPTDYQHFSATGR